MDSQLQKAQSPEELYIALAEALNKNK